MRILCGLDGKYRGEISLHREVVRGEGGEGGEREEEEEEEDEEDVAVEEEEGSLTFLAKLCSLRWWVNLFRGCYRGVINPHRRHHHPSSPSAASTPSSPTTNPTSLLNRRGTGRRRAVGWCPQVTTPLSPLPPLTLLNPIFDPSIPITP